MASKTVLIVDDEQGFIEPLKDALEHDGYSVLTATNLTDAMRMLQTTRVDLVTVDIMMPAGPDFSKEVPAHRSGLFLCRKLLETRPAPEVLCISVVSDEDTVLEVKRLGIRFMRKGETPLRTVLAMIRSRLTGIAYSTDDERL